MSTYQNGQPLIPGTSVAPASAANPGSMSSAHFSFTESIKTSWDAGNRLRPPVSRVTLGTDHTGGYNLSGLACETLGGFRVTMNVKIKTSLAASVLARINGSASANTSWCGNYAGGTTSLIAGNGGILTTADNDYLYVIFECMSPATALGTRFVRVVCEHYRPSGGQVGRYVAVGQFASAGGEIASVGIQSGNPSAVFTIVDYTVERFL